RRRRDVLLDGGTGVHQRDVRRPVRGHPRPGAGRPARGGLRLYALPATVAIVLGVLLVTTVASGPVRGYLVLAVLVVVLAIPYVADRSDVPLPADAPRPTPRGAAGWLRAFFVTPWRQTDFRWAFAGRLAVYLAQS